MQQTAGTGAVATLMTNGNRAVMRNVLLGSVLRQNLIATREVLPSWHAICVTTGVSGAPRWILSTELARGASDDYSVGWLPCPCCPVKPLRNVAR